MKTEEKRLNERLQRLKDEEKVVRDDMERTMSYTDEGGKKISAGLKDKNMTEVEAGYKLLSLERKKRMKQGKDFVKVLRTERKLRAN